MNIEKLTKSHLEWADMVFIGAMIIQKESALEVIARCREANLPVVAGGPLFSHLHQEIQGVDHFILGEAEEILGEFLDDLAAGIAKPLYQAQGHRRSFQDPDPGLEPAQAPSLPLPGHPVLQGLPL